MKTASKFNGFGNQKSVVSKSVVPYSDTKSSSLAKSNTKSKAHVNSKLRKYSWMADDHWDDFEEPKKSPESPFPPLPKSKPFSKAEAILRQINGFMWFLLFAIFFFSIMFRGCF